MNFDYDPNEEIRYRYFTEEEIQRLKEVSGFTEEELRRFQIIEESEDGVCWAIDKDGSIHQVSETPLVPAGIVRLSDLHIC